MRMHLIVFIRFVIKLKLYYNEIDIGMLYFMKIFVIITITLTTLNYRYLYYDLVPLKKYKLYFD